MTKMQLLQELSTIQDELKSFAASFHKIKKSARDLYTKASGKADLKKIEEIRTRLGQ